MMFQYKNALSPDRPDAVIYYCDDEPHPEITVKAEPGFPLRPFD